MVRVGGLRGVSTPVGSPTKRFPALRAHLARGPLRSGGAFFVSSEPHHGDAVRDLRPHAATSPPGPRMHVSTTGWWFGGSVRFRWTKLWPISFVLTRSDSSFERACIRIESRFRGRARHGAVRRPGRRTARCAAARSTARRLHSQLLVGFRHGIAECHPQTEDYVIDTDWAPGGIVMNAGLTARHLSGHVKS